MSLFAKRNFKVTEILPFGKTKSVCIEANGHNKALRKAFGLDHVNYSHNVSTNIEEFFTCNPYRRFFVAETTYLLDQC